ncbi:MAG: hypothetical protein JWN98_2255 [Abditibacteriota bacterium]|nr:hypothetical protein [Abditibacteriota bacterium]
MTTEMAPHDQQLEYWDTVFAGSKYFYGSEPGPVARRAVRYHRPVCPSGGTAIDFGCGEGQDLAFLAAEGYDAVGIEFTAHGVAKTRQLLAGRALSAEVRQMDLRKLEVHTQYDLVLAVNSLQFLGPDADAALDRVIKKVAPRGVLGLSLFAREEDTPPVENDIYRATLSELQARLQSVLGSWQMLEAANLWQWNRAIDRPQAFVTLIAHRMR